MKASHFISLPQIKKTKLIYAFNIVLTFTLKEYTVEYVFWKNIYIKIILADTVAISK